MGLTFLLGSPLISSWINAILWTVGLHQANSIWEDLSPERLRMKLFVALVILVDTASFMIVCAQIWIIQGSALDIPLPPLPGPGNATLPTGNITFPGLSTRIILLSPLGALATDLDLPDLSDVKIQWTYPVIIGLTGVSAILAHGFLLRRLWAMSRNLYMVLPVAALAVLAFIGAFMTTGVIARYPQLSGSARWDLSSRIWEISSAATDIILAMGLLFCLSRAKTSFKATQTLLRRLMLTAVETGATTSILFIVICILLVSPANQPIAVALQLILGRTYTNTLLYNLQVGKRVRRGSSAVRTGTRSGETPAAISLNGIQVKRTVQEHHDLEADPSRSDTEGVESKAALTQATSHAEPGRFYQYPPTSPVETKVGQAV